MAALKFHASRHYDQPDLPIVGGIDVANHL